jgi:hypothetical protein
MDIDTDRIDDAVLALLLLGLHDGRRAWKSLDWDALDRLHAKGLISHPVGKAKSVVFTDEGWGAPARCSKKCSHHRRHQRSGDAACRGRRR